jgi:predicted DNA-binding transcriptional regulator AlpA
MKERNVLLFTLNIFEFRSIIADVFEEKFAKLTKKTKEKKEDLVLISRIQTAKFFAVSKTTIDKWRRFKMLPPEIRMSSRVFFDKNQIVEALRRKQNNPSEFYKSGSYDKEN